MREFLENFPADNLAVLRIQPIMRIAERVNIPFGARDLPGRYFKNSGLKRRIQITVRPHLNFRVAALLNQWRQPTDLEIPADKDKDVGSLQL